MASSIARMAATTMISTKVNPGARQNFNFNRIP
jgi:hypothetical protein